MDSAAAAQSPVREPVNVGDLGLLARQAMLKRMEGAQAGEWFREEVQQEVTSRGVHAPREEARPSAAAQFSAPAAGNRQATGDQPATLHERPFTVTDLFPHQRVLKDRRSSGDGNLNLAVQAVQRELQSIRAEISALSKRLPLAADLHRTPQGTAVTETVHSDANRETAGAGMRAKDTVRAVTVAEQRLQMERELELMLQRHELQRIGRRQRALLAALRRAEALIAQAGDDLPAGMRDVLIGQIYRARYSIAMFGGAMGGAQLSGLAFDNAA